MGVKYRSGKRALNLRELLRGLERYRIIIEVGGPVHVEVTPISDGLMRTPGSDSERRPVDYRHPSERRD